MERNKKADRERAARARIGLHAARQAQGAADISLPDGEDAGCVIYINTDPFPPQSSPLPEGPNLANNFVPELEELEGDELLASLSLCGT